MVVERGRPELARRILQRRFLEVDRDQVGVRDRFAQSEHHVDRHQSGRQSREPEARRRIEAVHHDREQAGHGVALNIDGDAGRADEHRRPRHHREHRAEEKPELARRARGGSLQRPRAPGEEHRQRQEVSRRMELAERVAAGMGVIDAEQVEEIGGNGELEADRREQEEADGARQAHMSSASSA